MSAVSTPAAAARSRPSFLNLTYPKQSKAPSYTHCSFPTWVLRASRAQRPARATPAREHRARAAAGRDAAQRGTARVQAGAGDAQQPVPVRGTEEAQPSSSPLPAFRRAASGLGGVALALITSCSWPQSAVAEQVLESQSIPAEYAQTTDEARVVADLVRQARLEPDPEIGEELWGEAVARDPANPAGWEGRGAVRLLLHDWEGAAADLQTAADIYAEARGPFSRARPDMQLLNALGTAEGARGNWARAAELFAEVAEATKIPEADRKLQLPEPIGGANRLHQKASANLMFARFQTGDDAFAVAQAELILADDPAYWDARAGQAAIKWAAGDVQGAERAWQLLCTPSGKLELGQWVSRNGSPDQPGSEARGAEDADLAMKLSRGGITQVLKFLTEVENAQLSNKCEDITNGLELPCDDAGMLGMGGENAPCSMYTREEVQRRLWPPRAVDALTAFLKNEKA